MSMAALTSAAFFDRESYSGVHFQGDTKRDAGRKHFVQTFLCPHVTSSLSVELVSSTLGMLIV
jgi:hypothetical protein